MIFAENTIYCVLLALHNIAFVLLTGGLYYLWLLHRKRNEFEQVISQPLDQIIEDHSHKCSKLGLTTIGITALTGFGFPIASVIFHGQTKELTPIAGIAFGLKVLLVAGIFAILMYWVRILRKKIDNIYSQISDGKKADDETVKQFLGLRLIRQRWIGLALLLAILTLIVTPVISWGNY